MRVLVVGGGAREHAIADAVTRGGRAELYAIASNRNPGLLKLAAQFEQCDERNVNRISAWAKERAVGLAVIGHETALDAGVTDALLAIGIPTVGPTRAAAQVEMSKLYLRQLMDEFDIPGRVSHSYFNDADRLAAYLHGQSRPFVLKPLGLTGGKGVKVMGVHLQSVDEAIQYGTEVIRGGGEAAGIVVEDRLEGHEFTLQVFTDGFAMRPMPLVQDFKRAFEGDRGPNTGSMGSYSRSDGLLPFVSTERHQEALTILRGIIAAVRAKGSPFRGILYGQFMATAGGVRVVETNARFGDPEAANILPLLTTDFLDVCHAITRGCLGSCDVQFERKATVCKYVAPEGYPDHPVVDSAIELNEDRIHALGVKVYFARLNEKHGRYLTTTSRCLALVGVGDTVSAAEGAVERALLEIKGRYHVRHDIGRPELIGVSQ